MAFKFTILLACVASSSVSFAAPQLRSDRVTSSNFNFDFDFGQENQQQSTTPIPILRYIDTQNPDGSYTFGYESGDGTYKIETRYATGEVKGKYGYYDDQGQLREVEYGATPDGGFKPTGNGLTLPSIVEAQPKKAEVKVVNGRRANVVRRKRPQQVPEEPRQSTRSRLDDPRVQLPSRRRQQPTADSVRRLPIRPAQPRQTARPAQPRQTARPAQPRQTARPVQPVQPVQLPQPDPISVFRSAQPVQPVQALPLNADRFLGHPAQNIDLNTGSYTIVYSG